MWFKFQHYYYRELNNSFILKMFVTEISPDLLEGIVKRHPDSKTKTMLKIETIEYVFYELSDKFPTKLPYEILNKVIDGVMENEQTSFNFETSKITNELMLEKNLDKTVEVTVYFDDEVIILKQIYQKNHLMINYYNQLAIYDDSISEEKIIPIEVDDKKRFSYRKIRSFLNSDVLDWLGNDYHKTLIENYYLEHPIETNSKLYYLKHSIETIVTEEKNPTETIVTHENMKRKVEEKTSEVKNVS